MLHAYIVAGHGKQVEDYNGDEADHLDEGKSSSYEIPNYLAN